jgi:excisionase family DNA binding protein
MSNEIDVLLTPAEAAAYMRVQQCTLAKWRCQGGGPMYVKLSGRTIRYKKSDVEAAIANSLRSDTSKR